jgi:ChrR Cupin-like domain
MFGEMHVDDRCFADLAPFYALDGLSAEEQLWAEAQMLEMPELAVELAEFQATVAALAYAVPPVPMATGLKARLFERIGVDLPDEMGVPVDSGAEAIAAQAGKAVRSENLVWKAHRLPKIRVATLHIDRVTRSISALFKAEPGMQYPSHRHGGVEEIYMLEGDLWFGEQCFGPGDYIRSELGSRHVVAHSQDGCMFFIRSSLDNEYEALVVAGYTAV